MTLTSCFTSRPSYPSPQACNQANDLHAKVHAICVQTCYTYGYMPDLVGVSHQAYDPKVIFVPATSPTRPIRADGTGAQKVKPRSESAPHQNGATSDYSLTDHGWSFQHTHTR